MKKATAYFQILFCVVFLHNNAISQTLTSVTSSPIAGDSLTYRTADYVAQGPSGLGQVWDFSMLNYDGKGYTITYVNSDSLNTPSSFSISNLVCKNAEKFYYLLSDSAGIFEKGSSSSIGGQSPNNYYSGTLRELYLKYPIMINSTYNHHAIWEKGGITDTYSGITADATGTLITSSATYSNAIRIRRQKTELTGIDAARRDKIFTDNYEWYVPNIHGPVLIVASVMIDPYTHPTMPKLTTYQNWVSVYSNPQNPLGIHDDVEFNNSFSFQNPTENTLTIKFHTQVSVGTKVELFNFSGKKLLVQNLTEYSNEIDVSAFCEGVYLLSVSANSQQAVFKKFVIQRN